MSTRTHKRPQTAVDDRLLFRLDFALRGHGAYADPLNVVALIELIEAAGLRLGAPLLRYIDDVAERTSF
jgi:hypothetical protein